MKVRYKKTGEEFISGDFNTCGLGEIIVGNDRCGQDSDFQRDYDVWLKQSQQWKDLNKALEDHDVITDNYNTRFFEPPTPEDRERGYTLG